MREGAKSVAARLDLMKREGGKNGRDDKPSGIEIRMADALAKINPTLLAFSFFFSPFQGWNKLLMSGDNYATKTRELSRYRISRYRIKGINQQRAPLLPADRCRAKQMKGRVRHWGVLAVCLCSLDGYCQKNP
jgi:hypothetical protein